MFTTPRTGLPRRRCRPLLDGSQGAITVLFQRDDQGDCPGERAWTQWGQLGAVHHHRIDGDYSVSGEVTLSSGCGSNTPPVTVTLTQGSTLIQTTTTTNNNGSFMFSGVPNGTYSVTPSISGASSIFYPSPQSVSVSNNNVTNANFNATFQGYTVSGSVSLAAARRPGRRTCPLFPVATAAQAAR